MDNSTTISFLLTKECNQQCSYCNVYRGRNSKCVDIDEYSWILNNMLAVKPIHIELSGGEPGLIENLDEVIQTSLSCGCKTTILSNGLVRQNKYLDGRDDVFYLEHFCENLTPSLRTNAFYGSSVDMFTTDARMLLLVLTDETLDVLLNNPKDMAYWGSLSLVPKVITPKTFYPDWTLLRKTERVLRLFLKNRNIGSITWRETQHQLGRLANKFRMCKERQTYCATHTPRLYIDLDTHMLGQCCINIEETQKTNITTETLKLAMEGKLFTPTPFCYKCYKYI